MSVFDFITGRSIRKRKIRRAGRNLAIQVVKILMTKRFKGKISGLRDQVGSPDFKLGLKLLGVLFVNSLLGVADLCNCSNNKEQWAQY